MLKKRLIILILAVLAVGVGFYSSDKSDLEKVPDLRIPMPGNATPENVSYELGDYFNLSEKEMKLVKLKKYSDVESEKYFDALSLKLKINGTKKSDDRAIFNNDNELFLWVEKGTNKFIFRNEAKISNATLNKNIPSDQDSVKIAIKFLKDNGLYDSNLVVGPVNYDTVWQEVGKEKIINKNVTFYRQINNVPVYGVSRLIVTIGNNGEIEGVAKYFRDIEGFTDNYPLRNLEEALNDVKNNKASSSINPKAKKALIKNVKISWWEDAGNNEEQPYIQPVYTFIGETDVDGNIEEFDAITPAIQNKLQN